MINGINPTSFNDYPKEISYVIFLGGCNFRCPYCHNSSIVDKKTKNIELDDIVKDLKRRKKFVNAVVVTGGEPTIYGKKLLPLLQTIKDLGFKLKLDTNGTNPKLLREIIDHGLVDYIAMDIKNTFSKYESTINSKININDLKHSIEMIEKSNIEYEFRTTINKKDHTLDDLNEIVTYMNDPEKYILQNYQYNDEQIVKEDFGKFSAEELEHIKSNLNIGVKM